MIGVAKNQNVSRFDEQVADVAEVHRQRREQQAEAQREDQLDQHDHRKPEQVGQSGIRCAVDPTMNAARISSPRKKCTMFASTLTIGSTSAGKQHLLDQIAAGDQRAGASISDGENHVHGRMPQNMNSAYGSSFSVGVLA